MFKLLNALRNNSETEQVVQDAPTALENDPQLWDPIIYQNSLIYDAGLQNETSLTF